MTHSEMYPDMVRLYDGGEGALTKNGLKKAVTRKWITDSEYQEITGGDNTGTTKS